MSFLSGLRETLKIKEYTVTHNPDQTTTFEKNGYQIVVRTTDFTAWKNGALIQNAMPYLNDEQREFIITHRVPK